MDARSSIDLTLDEGATEELLGILTAHAQVQRVMRDHEGAARTEVIRNEINDQLRAEG